MKKWMRELLTSTLASAMLCTMPAMAAAAAEVEADIEGEQVAVTEAVTEEDISDVITTSELSGTVFDDVQGNDWYQSYVTYVLNKGIMTGKGENKFAPGEELFRAQFATVLYRIAGSPDVAYRAEFTDVPDGTFYTKAVLWASQEDVAIITGYDDGCFGPNDRITREQLATMLYRFALYKGFEEITPAELDEYPDAEQVSDFAGEAMGWAVGAGIITGDNGMLKPQGNTNRAVCAAMIQRFCERFMPGELQDIEMSAKCTDVTLTQSNSSDGSFWMSAKGLTASMEIQKVQAKVWCYDVNSDARWYTLSKQADGSYGGAGSVISHGYHFGTYYVQIYVMLSNGVRVYTDWASGQVTGTEAQIRVANHVNSVYNQVGRDLYSCYMWVANNVSYLRLPNPLEPPAGYTRAEWYSIQAFENRQGNCYCFAAAFYFLAKGLGYDAEFIEGRVKLRSGGYNLHGWVVIHLDGASYICDPESTRDIGKYNFYMQPVSSPVLQYEW